MKLFFIEKSLKLFGLPSALNVLCKAYGEGAQQIQQLVRICCRNDVTVCDLQS